MKGIAIYSRNLVVCLVSIFANAATGHAAANLKLVSVGNGVYSLQGTGFNGVAGTDVVIQYDQTALANPKVTWGSLASGYPVSNTNTAGQVHIAAVNLNANATSPGRGTFVTITFDTVGQSSGNITANANLIDNNGDRLSPEQVSVVPIAGSSGTSQTSQEADNNSVTASTTGSGTNSNGNTSNFLLGRVTMPTDGTAAPEKVKEQPPPLLPEPVQEKEKTIVTANTEVPQPANEHLPPEKVSEKKSTPAISVLERFRLYEGDKSPKALMALFKNVEGILQEPLVALSDGNSKIKVFIEHHYSGKQVPYFSLKGAKLASYRMEGESEWVIELVPDKGVYKATITIMQDGGIKEIPLTVAPHLSAKSKIDGKRKLTEADFILFLKERGTEKSPRFDLNGDGKRDYIDDYIFTANFITQTGKL
jgi:hypothetical protein